MITTQASDALGRIHERTPLITPPDMREDWLDPHLIDVDLVHQVLDAVPEPHRETHEVSTAVNNVRNSTPDLLAPTG